MVVSTIGFMTPMHLAGLLSLTSNLPLTRTILVLGPLFGVALSLTFLRSLPMRGCYALHTPLPPAVKLILALTALIYSVFLLCVFCSFPDGLDADRYHINVALRWLQSGTLRIDTSMGWPYALPGNAELPALFCLAAKLPNAVALGNLFSAALLAVSVYLIAWRVTAQSEPSLLAAILALTIPMFVFHTFELYVELPGTAFLLAAAALLVWRAERPVLCVFLSGYAAGFAIGSKQVFWVYAGVFAAAALVCICRGKHRVTASALFASGIVLSSGLWFFRAVSETGDVLYPLRIDTLSISQSVHAAGPPSPKPDPYSPGQMTRVKPVEFNLTQWLSDFTQMWIEDPYGSGVPVSADRGTGPLFAGIAIPGVIFLIAKGIRRKLSHGEAILLAAVLTSFALWATVLYQIPRFAIPVMAIACAASAPMLQSLLLSVRRIPLTLFLIGVPVTALVCLPVPCQNLWLQFRSHDWSRATYYGYPALIDTWPAGTSVADHTADQSSFQLAGAHLTNAVLRAPDLAAVAYTAKTGPLDPEDALLLTRGATLIYNGVPPNLHPKTAQRWRIYRMPH